MLTFLAQYGMMLEFKMMMIIATIVWMLFGAIYPFLKGSDGPPTFSRLPNLFLSFLILTLVKSGFLIIRKNRTPFRPNLAISKTLPSLLTVKLATEEPCHKYEPPPCVIKNAGKVTWQYNKEHRKN